ncbi:hypothetical protein BH23CHL2_BH23CHL2_14760 [soil metagenome]
MIVDQAPQAIRLNADSISGLRDQLRGPTMRFAHSGTE